MEQWIHLKRYDRSRPNFTSDYVSINTDKIETVEEGDLPDIGQYVTIKAPGATLVVAGTRVRVIDTPEEIFAKMGGEWIR